MNLTQRKWAAVMVGFALIIAGGVWAYQLGAESWTSEEVKLLQSLSLRKLSPLTNDPTNRYAQDAKAVQFGKKLFFDTRFSRDGDVACASCHVPALGFQDGKAVGLGTGIGTRRTMPIANTAYSPWLFWDGRKDSQWSQALGPLENPVEHGSVRTNYVQLIEKHYKTDYEAVFGTLPDFNDPTRFPSIAGPVEEPKANAAWQRMNSNDREQVTKVFVNMGKAIAAYERQIVMLPSRFDDYVDGLSATRMSKATTLLSANELAGLQLFIGKGNCVQCHNGPLMTNNEFHNTGVPKAVLSDEDLGRANGVASVKQDEFNCLSRYSDATSPDVTATACAELRFIQTNTHLLERAFKVPSLRNVASRAPYMHAGQFSSLAEVVRHYVIAPDAPQGHSEIKPLALNATEQAQLIAFLQALDAPIYAP
jgi:cytochrome c peroxidase